MKKGFVVTYVFFAIFVVLISLFVFFVLIYPEINEEQLDTPGGRNEYCKDNGWDGIEWDAVSHVYRCYRNTPSDTGLGNERIMSGIIK